MRSIVEERFTILDDCAQDQRRTTRCPATLSIGVGRDAQAPRRRLEKFANQALDMALGRGGDQAAVKNENGYEFYGGVSKGIEKRTKVKTRIVAAALLELLQIPVPTSCMMGHRFCRPGLSWARRSAFTSRSSRWASRSRSSTQQPRQHRSNRCDAHLLEQGFETAVHRRREVALEYVQEDTLLIIVDVHTPHFIEAPGGAMKSARTVVVIDHHRKMVDYIDNAVIFYHEPYASSASEMVAELVQYFGDEYKPIQRRRRGAAGRA